MTTRKTKFYQTNMFWSAVVLGLIVSPFVVKFFVYWREFDHHRAVTEKMDLAILRLSLECPNGLAESQWAYCVTWTWILHGNYGCLPNYVSTDDLDRIAEDLNRKIDQGANLETIDWIWDQYILAYPRIAVHNNWRPTAPENKETFDNLADQVLSDGEYSLSHWRMKYQRTLSKVEKHE